MSGFSPISMFKRAFRSSEVLENQSVIAVGDKFQHLDRQLSVWVVEKISEVSTSSLPLISLSREGRPDLKKVLSLSALQDEEEFRPTLQ